MFHTVQVVFLIVALSALQFQVRAQGFYSTYNTPYQNSFAFATPNLKQIFTTKLAGPQIQQFSQQLQDQQVYNLPQQNLFNGEQNGGVYSTSPQQFQNEEIRQQMAYYLQQQQQQQLQQQLQAQQLQAQQLQAQQLQQSQQLNQQSQQLQQAQQQQQYLEQFQAPFLASQRDNNFDRQANPSQEKRQNLLGVAYSPSTQVSQVKFDSGKLKYDF